MQLSLHVTLSYANDSVLANFPGYIQHSINRKCTAVKSSALLLPVFVFLFVICVFSRELNEFRVPIIWHLSICPTGRLPLLSVNGILPRTMIRHLTQGSFCCHSASSPLETCYSESPKSPAMADSFSATYQTKSSGKQRSQVGFNIYWSKLYHWHSPASGWTTFPVDNFPSTQQLLKSNFRPHCDNPIILSALGVKEHQNIALSSWISTPWPPNLISRPASIKRSRGKGVLCWCVDSNWCRLLADWP